MNHFRWACWASFCAAWCFFTAGLWYEAGAWFLIPFSVLMGVMCIRWAAICWKDHIKEQAKLENRS